MNGLLGSIDDPRTAGLLGLGLRLMSTPGKFGQALGQSGLGAMGDMRQAQASQDARKKAGLQEQLVMLQLAQAQQQQAAAQQAAARKAKDDEILAGSFRPMPGPMPDGSAGVQPRFDVHGMLGRGLSMDSVPEALKLQAALNPPRKLTAYKPGDQVRDEATGEVAFSVPDKAPDAPSDWRLYQLSGAQQSGIPFDEWNRANKRSGASSVSVTTDSLGLKPKDRFEMEGRLADDYKGVTKLDALVLSSTGKIKTALSQDGAIKDQAAIYAFAKMLDPEGAVREADYAAIANTTGLVDRVRNYTNRLMTGEQLNPTQRGEMLTLAKAFEDIASKRMSAAQADYTQQAQRYNLRPEAVFSGSKLPTPANPATPAAPGTLSAAEAAELEQLRARFGKK
jgi:hypothetical protein